MQRWSWDKCRYGEELLSKIAGCGVHVPVARTFGMDHIGLDAAARLAMRAMRLILSPTSRSCSCSWPSGTARLRSASRT